MWGVPFRGFMGRSVLVPLGGWGVLLLRLLRLLLLLLLLPFARRTRGATQAQAQRPQRGRARGGPSYSKRLGFPRVEPNWLRTETCT